MPHLPDDDGYEPPLKVLRKRFNGVYREDHGLSGPTRRYILMVVMLVALASVPTLAVITAGTREISGNDRSGAMDAPFLPPPVSGPVRPTPKPQNHSAYDHPALPPSHRVQPPAASPGVSSPGRTSDPIPVVPGLPPVPDDEPPAVATRPSRPPAARPKPADKGVSDPGRITVFPTVPGLPAVPDEDWEAPLGRRAPVAETPDYDDSGWDEPDSSDDADSADEIDYDSDDHSDHDDDSDRDNDSDRDSDHDDGSDDPDPDDSSHHECEARFRSTIADRPRTGPITAGGQQ